jgi:hypothetical protein
MKNVSVVKFLYKYISRMLSKTLHQKKRVPTSEAWRQQMVRDPKTMNK